MKNLIAGFSLGLTGLDTQTITTSLIHRFMMASLGLALTRLKAEGAGLVWAFCFCPVAFTVEVDSSCANAFDSWPSHRPVATVVIVTDF